MALHSVFSLLTGILLMALVSGQANEVTISLQVSEPTVTVGQRVVFTCTIQGITTDTLVNFNKIVMDYSEVSNIKRETITGMTSKTGLYRALDRYLIERTTDGTAVVYRLTINGTQHDDNGGYSCSVPDTEKYAVKQLIVYRIPDSLRFVHHNESDWITVAEDQRLENLTCLASRLMPLADLSVLVGDRNVTDAFLISPSVNVLCREVSDLSKKCPLSADLNIAAESRDFRPRYTDNNKALTCSLKMRVLSGDQLRTTVRLNVTHGPKVLCPLTLPVQVTANTAKLSCTVYANPINNHLNLSWIISELTGNSVSVDSSSSSNEYSVEHAYSKEEPTKVVTTLVFKTKNPVFSSVKSASLSAANPTGTGSSGVIYVKKQADPSNGGSSAVQLSSFYVFILSTLVVVTSFMMASRRD